MKKTDYRVERDSIGVKDIPEDVYYGVQSLRAAENFHITGLNMHPEIINTNRISFYTIVCFFHSLSPFSVHSSPDNHSGAFSHKIGG